MYIQVWKKYLPIIKILMKRSATNEQTLDMNRTDFSKSVTTRKTNYGFNIEFKKGRLSNTSNTSALAKQLTEVLLEDDTARNLLRQSDFELSMNNKFQLSIKNSNPQAPPKQEDGITNGTTENDSVDSPKTNDDKE